MILLEDIVNEAMQLFLTEAFASFMLRFSKFSIPRIRVLLVPSSQITKRHRLAYSVGLTTSESEATITRMVLLLNEKGILAGHHL